MLSYQHVYHAGGPADVHKHALLALLLEHLRSKPKPFVVLDVHAGEGAYGLHRPEAGKTAEYQRGIVRAWPLNPSEGPLAPYLTALHAVSSGEALSVAPGSPAIMRAALRDQDRLIVNELHPAAAIALHRWAANDSRIAVHRRDATEVLGALLPPAIRRGLVLVDPSYEERDAYADTAKAVAASFAKWPEGIFMVWYPLLADRRHTPLVQGLSAIAAPMLSSELDLDSRGLADAPALGLRGSGVIVINPPWQFSDAARSAGDALAGILGDGPKAAHRLTWIHPDR